MYPSLCPSSSDVSLVPDPPHHRPPPAKFRPSSLDSSNHVSRDHRTALYSDQFISNSCTSTFTPNVSNRSLLWCTSPLRTGSATVISAGYGKTTSCTVSSRNSYSTGSIFGLELSPGKKYCSGPIHRRAECPSAGQVLCPPCIRLQEALRLF